LKSRSRQHWWVGDEGNQVPNRPLKLFPSVGVGHFTAHNFSSLLEGQAF